ncbi:MAG TPA: tyrosine--tRNA ligase, partial [Desulfobacteraceae bacterium]|nr:tyrosine--tRNA ligase [Desulfobacteraceae bacterium]
KEKMNDPEKIINVSFLLNDRYILVQKGKKNYFLIVAT